jgi:hypothetical protein
MTGADEPSSGLGIAGAPMIRATDARLAGYTFLLASEPTPQVREITDQ